MNKGFMILLVAVLAVALFIGGVFFGQSRGNMMGFQTNTSDNTDINMMGNGMMDGEMMSNGSTMMGNGMMNGGMMNGDMMNGDMMAHHSGMMGGGSQLYGVEPLAIADVEKVVTDYLSGLNNDELAVGEIMIFDNHAYAEVVDKSAGTGAFELLIDPITLAVNPEPGANMMWNTQYGSMSGMMGSMMGSMMNSTTTTGKMSITPGEAITAAQRYLDSYLPGATVNTEADPFPGYYTLHILRDGETVGMLSVNGYTGQILLHHWHGNFVEMREETEE